MFRRSGSVACFFVAGSLPDPLGDSFLQALKDHRFHTIENAASEETAIGWVTPGDPTGNSFDREDLDRDTAVWLQMRIDKKTAPTMWLRIHRIAEERAAGRKLTANERRELKEDLISKLLPRVLPTIKLVDALYVPGKKMILLFSTARSVQEAFLSLFYKTFSVSLVSADPQELAQSLDLDPTCKEYLERVSPVPWPREARRAAPASREPAPEDTPAHAMEAST